MTRCAFVALLLLAVARLHAQAPQSSSPAKPAVEAKPAMVKNQAAPKTMDTGESIGFMGKSLWFEVRRRLNLTTEEEEKKHKEETKQVKLKVGGVRVEKSVEGPATSAPAGRN